MKVDQGDGRLPCSFNTTRLSLLALCCIVPNKEMVVIAQGLTVGLCVSERPCYCLTAIAFSVEILASVNVSDILCFVFLQLTDTIFNDFVREVHKFINTARILMGPAGTVMFWKSVFSSITESDSKKNAWSVSLVGGVKVSCKYSG